jgi:luciferase family oxidoreductase group 1
MIRLSVLDQSPAVAGRSHAESILDTLALARHCDALGYRRFWLSEHHNHDSIVGTAPEILISAIAATTARIRVGSAGMMLPNHSPLHVAEQFRVLEAIAPGRIDLGIGRAPGTDRRTALALNPEFDRDAQEFPGSVSDVVAWVSGHALGDDHPFAGVRAFPDVATHPEVWILGSSDYGARVAAHFGLPYCFAHFITDGRGAEEAVRIYRASYRPSGRHPLPQPAVAVWALAADTDAEAERLFGSRERWRVARDRGLLLPIGPPEEVEQHIHTPAELARIAVLRHNALIGSRDRLAARLRELAAQLEVDEIVVVTWTYDSEARRHSYALLADAFALG